MNYKTLLIGLSISLALSSCKKDRNDDSGTNTGTTTPPKPFTITEDFENGTKTSYDVGDVSTITGSWNMDGTLLGTDKSDIKDGKKDVRIQGTKNNAKRNGMLTMNFDVRHLSTISIKSAFTNFSDKQRVSSTVPVPLKATWELQVSKDGGKNFTKMGETVTDADTILITTTYKITDTTAQRFRIVNTSDYNGDNRVRINIDDIVFSGVGESGIVVGGSPDTAPVDTTSSSSATPARGVTVGTDAPPASGDNNNILLGMPSNANNITTTDYLINQGYYVESYNATRGTPNWVSWHLDATNTTQVVGRQDNFAAFSGLPSTFYAVQSNSYSGSGFDRGHNCPSADRTSSANANSATFLMTNMIPQAPNSNQETWANLENYLRAQTTQGYEVYIIMGSYGTGGTGSNGTANTINGGHVTVPSNVWKVAVLIPNGNTDIVRISNTTRVIAVNTPNVNSINSDWTKYIVTVRDIEKATGYNLLSQLPQSVQDAIETSKDSGI
ncbi:DNA/RNA non-specific endonuclease [Mucilaginibacter robiniae]|uniref:DNA/RNA non-specific endonuclease n=1 Tax=Mucilaginibacter robiniae TaxID=2728022 RepID=A0A7L5E5P2_9SPHI|nr:DNA/RNA non-specific endonuclease [Mucilaginibacter robiniae]QJD96173.1 DNA/RNA non-specific endonuclease [Mucilaginibacter robiniae]